jgi:cation:H+ antiporter
MMYAAGFLVCAVIIFFAGKNLSVYGDIIAEKTGLGKAWIGLILMATVTSLPELMVGISSSAIIQSADLAVGDILGSCAFNLGILALLDMFVPRKKHLFKLASPNNVLIAALGIILMTLVGFGIFTPKDFVLTSWIGLTSISFIIIYFVAIRLVYVNEQRHKLSMVVDDHTEPETVSLKTAAIRYGLYSIIIICAALALPYFADHIAELTGLGKSFVGTFFLAISTSLPEIAVSIAAVRIGSIDLAVGNLLGSNLFNIMILALDDIFYTKGHLLKHASGNNLISVFCVIIMTAVVIIGLTFPSSEKKYKMGLDALVIFLIYIFNLVLLYHFINL